MFLNVYTIKTCTLFKRGQFFRKCSKLVLTIIVVTPKEMQIGIFNETQTFI